MISDDVPSEPRNLQAAPLSPKSIEVMWEAPAQLKGQLMSYDLYYYIEGTDSEEEQVGICWSYMSSHWI